MRIALMLLPEQTRPAHRGSASAPAIASPVKQAALTFARWNFCLAVRLWPPEPVRGATSRLTCHFSR